MTGPRTRFRATTSRDCPVIAGEHRAGAHSLALWVAPVSNLAGVARHILDVARVGIPGWRLEVAAPEGPLLDELRALDVPVHPIALDANPAAGVRTLRNLVEELKPQIVHSHLARADFLVAAATVGLPTKAISTEHGIAGDPTLYQRSAVAAKLKQAAHHLRCTRFDALVAVSASTEREMRRAWRPRTPIHVVLNGVDALPSPPQLQAGKRYLSLARLSHEKNIDALVRAFALLDEDATLTIAGDGPERDALKALVEELGLRERVSMPGFLDATEALASHDVLVQLSRWENASYSLLDAVAHGLGVVATPVGGNPEILAEQCLVDASPVEKVAARMREQAEPRNRPTLPAHWPTVQEMTTQIAAIYDEVWR